MRYVQKRTNQDGTERWYWRRPGSPVRRLPDNSAARAAMVESLNASADNERAGQSHPEGSVAWAVERYRHSSKFTDLAATTRQAYAPWMKALAETIGGYHLSELTRGAIEEIVDGIEGPARKRHCVAVVSRIVAIGRSYNWITHNLTDKLQIPATGRREEIWSPAEEKRLFAACADDSRAEAARLGFLLLFYTGQRPSDMRNMTWAHFDGDRISVMQRKTQARRKIKCHKDLKAALQEAYPLRKGLPIVARPNGLAYSKTGWEAVYRRVRSVAQVEHLQMRDIRRTAAVRLGEAGCELHEIASVTGHSLRDLQVLFEVYLPKTTAMAENAITKLERRTDNE